MKSKMNNSLRSVLLSGVCLAMMGIGAPAFAQSDAVTSDEIVITAVRGAERSRLDTPTPVDVLSAEAIESAGALGGELGQTLQNLTPSFSFPRQSNSGTGDIVRAGQLRGMSPDQTLVLVNGKRRHTTAVVNLESKVGRGTTPVDFNALATSSVGRIEVLRDGAGAQYGSDAIAGVINIQLDSTPDTAELSLTYGAHNTDFDPIGDRITDGETVIVSAENGASFLGGSIRYGLEYKDREDTNRAGLDQIPFFENPSPANLAFQGRRNYRPGDPKVEDWSLWYTTEFPLGDFTAYSFATYANRDAEGAAFFRYPDNDGDNPGLVYPNGYRPVTTGAAKDGQFVLGIKHEGQNWTIDASSNYGESRFDSGVRNSLNPSFGAASARAFRLAKFENTLWAGNLDFVRDIAIGENGKLAFGFEARTEGFKTKAGDPQSYLAGPITTANIGAEAGPGLAPADTVDLERDVLGAYVELSGDVSGRLFLDAAARLEDYSDFGDTLAGKLSARLQLSDALALRGSASNSFRAPSLAQTGFQFSTTQFGTGGALETTRTLAPANPIARALGATDLQPEESVNFTTGLVVHAGRGFTLTIDAFQIEVDDRITLSERIGGDALEAFVLANFGVTGVRNVNFFTNAVDTRTRGYDVVLSHASDFQGGDLSLSLGASFAKTSIREIAAAPAQLQAIDPAFSLVGVEERNTLVSATPRDKIIGTAAWEGERFAFLGRVTRYGEATRVFNFGGGFEPEQTYGSELQLDLEATWTPNDNVALSIGGSNILDEYPDASIADISYFGNFPFDVVHPIGFNGAYWYARVKVTL
jgi:iron complex outermembrane receptor protein